MSNSYDLMRASLAEARDTMKAADGCANALAEILTNDGRLRHVAPWRLKLLKRQLQQFDANRERWKE
jgi:hypothetical protein